MYMYNINTEKAEYLSAGVYLEALSNRLLGLPRNLGCFKIELVW